MKTTEYPTHLKGHKLAVYTVLADVPTVAEKDRHALAVFIAYKAANGATVPSWWDGRVRAEVKRNQATRHAYIAPYLLCKYRRLSYWATNPAFLQEFAKHVKPQTLERYRNLVDQSA